MTQALQRVATRRWQLGAAGLIVVVAFGALLQGGVLAPKLHETSGGGGGPLPDGRYFSASTLRNVSWAAWTVTGVHVSGHGNSRVFADGSDVKIGVMPGNAFGPTVPPGPQVLVPKLTVRPGDEFAVVLFYQQRCPAPSSFANIAGAQDWLRTHPQYSVAVKATIDVATALGNQTTTTTLYVSCAV